MSIVKSNIATKGTVQSAQNPFIKMIEDKKNILRAIRQGKDLSKLKGIKFVSPI